MGRGMSLDQFKEALSSDATVENEKLKKELSDLKKRYEKKVKVLEEQLTTMKQDCLLLGNRCFVQTGGALCLSCQINHCDHKVSDEDLEAAIAYMKKNKMPKTKEEKEFVANVLIGYTSNFSSETGFFEDLDIDLFS